MCESSDEPSSPSDTPRDFADPIEDTVRPRLTGLVDNWKTASADARSPCHGRVLERAPELVPATISQTVPPTFESVADDEQSSNSPEGKSMSTRLRWEHMRVQRQRGFGRSKAWLSQLRQSGMPPLDLVQKIAPPAGNGKSRLSTSYSARSGSRCMTVSSPRTQQGKSFFIASDEQVAPSPLAVPHCRLKHLQDSRPGFRGPLIYNSSLGGLGSCCGSTASLLSWGAAAWGSAASDDAEDGLLCSSSDLSLRTVDLGRGGNLRGFNSPPRSVAVLRKRAATADCRRGSNGECCFPPVVASSLVGLMSPLASRTCSDVVLTAR